MRVKVDRETGKAIGPGSDERRKLGYRLNGDDGHVHIPGGEVGETYEAEICKPCGFPIALIEPLSQKQKDQYITQYSKATNRKLPKKTTSSSNSGTSSSHWTGSREGVMGGYGTPFKGRNKNHLLNGKL